MDQKSLAVRRAQWAQIVQDVNNAPISKKEWCAQNGINLKAFYYWQSKLRKQCKCQLQVLPKNHIITILK